MTRDDLKDYIRTHATSYLEPDRSGRGYICPIPTCGSGSGSDGTGISTRDGIHFTCWAGCYKHADIIDIIGQKLGIDPADFPAKLEAAAREMGIDPGSSLDQQQRQQIQRAKTEARKRAAAPDEPEPDYTDFFLQAHKHINETDYHRGLTQATLDRFQIGYVAEWKATATAPASPRLIIPTSKHSYLARDTRAELTEKQKRYSKQKTGHTRIFNLTALGAAQKPVVVVEGEIDALSVIDIGGEAIGLGSISHIGKMLDRLKEQKPAQPLIIALDNDTRGQDAARKLAEGLKALNIPYSVIDICPGYKDANEALITDREAFKDMIKRAEEQAIMEAANRTTDQAQAAAPEAEPIQEAGAKKPMTKEEYIKTNTASHLAEFVEGIGQSVNTPFISTGFKGLDKVLDGGLYEGLYIVGAISSLGKTTLITQIADQIAQGGKDVLIFSLEMARTELMAKSISRHTIQAVLESNGDTRNAKTARGITTGVFYAGYNMAELELIARAEQTYSTYAEHVFVSEGMGDIGTEEVRNTIKDHIRFTGNTPVVVIDYLQILAPADVRASDKQNTDKAVMELKRISRDYKTPVIAISSFNRPSYNVPASMEAFKESGGIEYSSDVLIGLQLKDAGGKTFDANAAKQKTPREVQLVILKNRNGKTGVKLDFKYYAAFNFFMED